MRLMEFLRSCWGSRHALERSRALPLNPSTKERVNVQSFRHFREPIEIRLPLDRHQRLLPRVAVLAGGNDVAARRSAAAAERHHVIHRQRAMTDASSAVRAHAVGDAALPPLALAELARLGALSSQRLGRDGQLELTHARRARSTAPPTRA